MAFNDYVMIMPIIILMLLELYSGEHLHQKVNIKFNFIHLN